MSEQAPYTDDFNRADGTLGSNWTDTYRGFGIGMVNTDGMRAPWNATRQPLEQQAVSLRLADASRELPRPTVFFPDLDRRVEVAETCAACGKRWAQGDVATSHNAAPFRHTDCDDPKLEAEDDEP